MTQLNHQDYTNLKKHIWICGTIIIGLLLVICIMLLNFKSEVFRKLDGCEGPKQDTVYIEKVLANEHEIPLIKNQRKEDSLQTRIIKVLDSLSILEDKLKFMQSNSSSSIDLIIGIADSIEYYRKETITLKKEIEQLNAETKKLLQQERKKHERLKKQLSYYEKRSTTLYALNLEVITYSDGFDQNNKLMRSDKARKIKEISISFNLSRELNQDEEDISIKITRGTEVYFVFNKVRAPSRQVTRKFKVTSVTRPTPGNYTITVYHDYPKFEIENAIIGQTTITLD